MRTRGRWELVLEQACSLHLFHLEPPPNTPSVSAFFPIGGTLVWQDNTAVNYSNWGPPGLGPSMLSHNSCYWIQSSSGLWRPGACTNITMGVVCKLPRGERPQGPPLSLPRPGAPGAGLGPPGRSPGIKWSVQRTGPSCKFPNWTADPSFCSGEGQGWGSSPGKPFTDSVTLGLKRIFQHDEVKRKKSFLS